MEKVEGKYLYCIVSDSERTPTRGYATGKSWARGFSESDSGGEVYPIFHKNLAVLVKDSRRLRYMDIPRDKLFKKLNEHQKIVERAMEQSPTLPIKFGTWMKEERDVKQFLAQGYFRFIEMMEFVRGKIEIELLVTFEDVNLIFREIAGDREIQKIQKEFQNKGELTLEERVMLGRKVKALFDDKKTMLSKEINAPLDELSLASQAHCLLNDSMVMNRAYLLLKNREKEFDERVRELNEKFQNTLNFKCVGPLAPFSFNTIEVTRIDPEKITESLDLLGLKDDFSIIEVKEKYRKLASIYHPDKSPERESEFDKIKEAYKNMMSFCHNFNFSLNRLKEEDGTVFGISRFQVEAGKV